MSNTTNKSDLIAMIAETAGFTKKDAEKALDATISSITKAVNGGKLQLVGFGTFEKKTRKARTGRNPQTGAEIKIPATTVVSFKAGKTLKDSVK